MNLLGRCKNWSERRIISVGGGDMQNKALFGFFFLSLITLHLIFITHHSSLKILQLSTPSLFGTITQLVITQNFQLFVGSILVTWCSFYFFSFLFSFNPQCLNSTKPVEEKKKKNLNEEDQDPA